VAHVLCGRSRIIKYIFWKRSGSRVCWGDDTEALLLHFSTIYAFTRPLQSIAKLRTIAKREADWSRREAESRICRTWYTLTSRTTDATNLEKRIHQLRDFARIISHVSQIRHCLQWRTLPVHFMRQGWMAYPFRQSGRRRNSQAENSTPKSKMMRPRIHKHAQSTDCSNIFPYPSQFQRAVYPSACFLQVEQRSNAIEGDSNNLLCYAMRTNGPSPLLLQQTLAAVRSIKRLIVCFRLRWAVP